MQTLSPQSSPNGPLKTFKVYSLTLSLRRLRWRRNRRPRPLDQTPNAGQRLPSLGRARRLGGRPSAPLHPTTRRRSPSVQITTRPTHRTPTCLPNVLELNPTLQVHPFRGRSDAPPSWSKPWPNMRRSRQNLKIPSVQAQGLLPPNIEPAKG